MPGKCADKMASVPLSVKAGNRLKMTLFDDGDCKSFLRLVPILFSLPPLGPEISCCWNGFGGGGFQTERRANVSTKQSQLRNRLHS